MKDSIDCLDVLRLFDEGAGASGADATDAQTGDAGKESGSVGNFRTKNGRGKRAGKFENVLFGKQETEMTGEKSKNDGSGGEEQHTNGDGADGVSGEKSGSSAEEIDRDAAFDKLIKGEYKEQFQNRTRQIIDRRFRAQREQQETIESQKKVIDRLRDLFPDAKNEQELLSALENDKEIWRGVAEANGMQEDQYLKFKQLQRKDRERAMLDARRQGEAEAQRIVQEWRAQENSLKEKYPEFSLDSEMQNEQFARMLKSGVPVEHAYHVMHLKEHEKQLEERVRKDTEKKVTDHIRARGQRAQENISGSASAMIVKDDVNALSKSERAEIARRARMGEKIVL